MKTILLTQGKEAVVDDADFEFLSRHKWCAAKRHGIFYAERYIRISDTFKILIAMHHAVAKPPEGSWVDHKDGNGLNNTRANLRPATRSQNKLNQRRYKNNTSGFKGVSKWGSKWAARIQLDRKSTFLGTFETAEDAHIAYCAAALQLHGEFARFE